MRNYLRWILASGVSMSALGLMGCELKQTAPIAVNGAALHGSVHGGQQPISGSSIKLYAAGSSGYGAAYGYSTGTDLLGNNVVTTDVNGNFNITGDYTCPSASTPVYLAAIGGNPGNSQNNVNISLMAALGACGNLTPSTFISMNEVTTVATVYALSQFMTSVANVGTSATNAQGLAHAFATVNKLADISTGSASGPALPAGATLPVAKINTLANILAACVNSAGGVAGDGSVCGTLFADTTVGGVAPTDTVGAMLNLAQHPNTQTMSLTNLASSSAPFQPSLITAPTDYSIVISYVGGGLSSPTGIAMDPSGNIWVPDAGNNSVTKLDNTGTAISGAGGFTAGPLNAPSAIALDTSGNAWVTNGNNTVTMLNASGSSGTVYSGGGLNSPVSVAIDALGSAWVSNAGNGSVTTITSGGVLTNYTGAGIASPAAIAIDPK